jgi:hypothetical protein
MISSLVLRLDGSAGAIIPLIGLWIKRAYWPSTAM